MISGDELKRLIREDAAFRRSFIRLLLNKGSFRDAEYELGIERGTVDKMLAEDEEFESELSSMVSREFTRIQKVEGMCRLNLALKALADQIVRYSDDPDKVIKAASALIKAQIDFSKQEAKMRDSDLERIWEELTSRHERTEDSGEAA